MGGPTSTPLIRNWTDPVGAVAPWPVQNVSSKGYCTEACNVINSGFEGADEKLTVVLVVVAETPKGPDRVPEPPTKYCPSPV